MSEFATKTGGTSHNDRYAFADSLSLAEEGVIHTGSAPGKIGEAYEESKVTDLSLDAHERYYRHGEVPKRIGEIITERFAETIEGAEHPAAARPILDTIKPRFEQAVRGGEHSASMFGERITAEVYESQGYTLLDPIRAPHDLGSDQDAWDSWLSVEYKPGKKYVIPGNTTKINNQLVTFGRGGTDETLDHAAAAIWADAAINGTDGGARSSDPRKFDGTKHIDHLLYDEGRALGRNGTGLVHPAAMIDVADRDIPTVIRSTFDDKAPETLLDNDYERAEYRAGRVIALSAMKHVVVYRVKELGMAEGVGRLEAFESELADNQIALIDSQSHGPDAQKYLVAKNDSEKAREILEDEVKKGHVDEAVEASFIIPVGYRIEDMYVAKLFSIVVDAGVDIDAKIRDGLPAPLPGRDSIRIAVHNHETDEVHKKLHDLFIGQDTP